MPSPDEDCATLSVNAARNALKRAGIDPQDIGAVYVGSESHPYAVKPTGTIVSEALGACPYVHTADLEFACKAGTEGMFIALQLVQTGAVKFALAIGADTSQGAPSDALEYSAAAGAAGAAGCSFAGRETRLTLTTDGVNFLAGASCGIRTSNARRIK